MSDKQDKTLHIKIDNVPLVPMEAVQPLIAKAHTDGAEMALTVAHKIDAAFTNIQTTLVYIGALANANNGQKTIKAMQEGKAKLTMAIDKLETVWIECLKYKGFILPEATRDYFIEVVRDIHPLVVIYLKEPTVQNQDAISLRCAAEQASFREVRGIIQAVTDNRGRNPDGVKLEIGRLALRHGRPGNRKAWLQGQSIYQDLCRIPENMRSDEQNEMINYLSLYMYPDKRKVAKDQRRKCGVYITEARELAIKSGN